MHITRLVYMSNPWHDNNVGLKHAPELSDELEISKKRPQQAGVLSGNQPRFQCHAEALLLYVHLSMQQNL